MDQLRTLSGKPYNDHAEMYTAGPSGPSRMDDTTYFEKIAHFNRENVPSRIVHAKGAGAYGEFVVTQDITKYTCADFLSTIGKKTRVFARFSTVGGEPGSADAERDPRGFAIKFYTEEGNYDMTGNNIPTFFIRSAKLFPDFIHTQKRDPVTNCVNPTNQWDFFSLRTESIHQVIQLFSDRGIPADFRHMHGFGSHTFSFINKDNELTWVKFHWVCNQGIKNLTAEEAEVIKGKNPDHATQDLREAIDRGDYPSWTLKVQLMTPEQARSAKLDPFDLTKVWPHSDFPLHEVGVMTLNENPTNFFNDVEQAAFNPANFVPGISGSFDKVLQGRLFAYGDAARYRLGVNHESLPVNCPFHRPVGTTQRGMMNMGNKESHAPNYYPNSVSKMGAKENLANTFRDCIEEWTIVYEEDDYSQARALYQKVMKDDERKRTQKNIANSMKGIHGPMKEEITERMLKVFANVDPELSEGIKKLLQ